MTEAVEAVQRNTKAKHADKDTIDLTKLTDFEISMLIIERDVSQYKVERIDELLNKIGEAKGFAEVEKKQPPDEASYNKMFWEKRNGAKGLFEMTSLKNCGNVDLFRHLVATMKQNNRRFTEKNWLHYYWLGQNDDNTIFRRRKGVSMINE